MPHIHQRIDFTVEVFVVHQGKVLLRKHDKYMLWLSVGGHIELDEDPNAAALREVREEVGLEVRLLGEKLRVAEEGTAYRELVPPRFVNRHRISDTHEHVTFVYFATADSDRVGNASDEKSQELKWFSRADLDDPKYKLRDSIRQYALAAQHESNG